MQDERWTAVEETKAALRHLAGVGRGSVVERAEAAVGDLEAAVAFVESGGLAELEAAIAATDDPALATRGERTLAAYRRFGAAAAGRPVDPVGTMEDERGHHRDRRDQTKGDDHHPGPRPHSDDQSGEQEYDGRSDQRACGERLGERDRVDVRHFHRGRGSDLRRDGEQTAR